MYKARINMFIQFTDNYKPADAQSVAKQWAEGIKTRNGVLQYVVLSKGLKKGFEELADESDRKAWVTGFSSPWVESYKISEISKSQTLHQV